MKDPWKHLRADLFGNVEPEVTLVGVSVPIEKSGDLLANACRVDDGDGPIWVPRPNWECIEATTAQAASTSYGSKVKNPQNLNRQLIQKGHLTPLEAIQFNFHVSGVSKACGAQMSRHRIGQGHVSRSRRYTRQQPAFVYPLLDYFTDEEIVSDILFCHSRLNREAYTRYKHALQLGAKKQDARLLIPVSSATERVWWVNARALRDFFRLRLAKDAECEIRRLANMVFDIVVDLTPSLFEDLRRREDEAVQDYGQ